MTFLRQNGSHPWGVVDLKLACHISGANILAHDDKKPPAAPQSLGLTRRAHDPGIGATDLPLGLSSCILPENSMTASAEPSGGHVARP
ncbi:hypothetical protein NHN26_12910 [Rhodovulum tesquicola]|uniref:hypothetical protein n=1 Tax=Rhodovulum tesquicola TaxID=540254 RepID=UPI0020971309|nr:hypothetical protein [Rhodovulum tesquicola]MCO8146121.1 hypothetical protein [Rhodovulum tesquicola]